MNAESGVGLKLPYDESVKGLREALKSLPIVGAPLVEFNRTFVRPPLDSLSERSMASQRGIQLEYGKKVISLISGPRELRIRREVRDLVRFCISSFDYLFDSVKPVDWFGRLLVDFSTPRFHEVTGYDLHPVMFSALSEPVVTSLQYIESLDIQDGETILDAGAYSGLSAFMFREAVGSHGRVIAIEADPRNFETLEMNYSLYRKIRGRELVAVNAALWHSKGNIDFSSEGDMTSNAFAVSQRGGRGGKLVNVPSFTLSNLIEDLEIETIDSMKLDIEGAELLALSDREFFLNHHPKIIFEAFGREGTQACIELLESYGYSSKVIKQIGVSDSLVLCT